MVIERRLNRQWKLTELSLKCACHSAHFNHWKIAESRISAKTEIGVFFLCKLKHKKTNINFFYFIILQYIEYTCFSFTFVYIFNHSFWSLLRHFLAKSLNYINNSILHWMVNKLFLIMFGLFNSNIYNEINIFIK